MVTVDWELLSQAMDFYHMLGFTRVDVPWIIDYSTVRATFVAEDSRIFEVKSISKKALIGSAEQAFYQMLQDGTLKSGKYVACSPCFRNEPEIDWLHQRQFMKVELINTDLYSLEEMIQVAFNFFARHAGSANLKRVKTEDGFDLELCGIEVGSYGIRHIAQHSWVYGTGVAEPRFSTALIEQETR